MKLKIVKGFFKKLYNSKTAWEGIVTDHNIEQLAEAAMYLVGNTRKREIFKKGDLNNINNIFNELNSLYKEVIKSDTSKKVSCIFKENKMSSITEKISCISEILCKNAVGLRYDSGERVEKGENINDGKIFAKYENLYLVINTINTRYEELKERGFSSNVFYDFWESFRYNRCKGVEKTETEKISLFMGLLDGTMKFQPQYEYKAVAFQVVPADFNETLVNNTLSKYSEGYGLKPK